MAHILYPEHVERPKYFINPYNMNSTRQWLKHYENWKYLDFIFKNSKDRREGQQANREMLKAQAKMDYWAKMPNFERGVQETGKKQIDAIWSQKS